MFAKHYSRAGVFAWSPRSVPEQGLIVVDYAQQFSAFSSSAAVETPSVDYVPLSHIYDQPRPRFKKEASVNAEFKCNDLVWTAAGASEEKPFGLLIGGCENGSVVVFDATRMVRDSRLEVLASRKDHAGHVLAVDVSADNKWAMSGGGSGQLLLWDLTNLATPFSPGNPTYPDQVKVVKWNGKMESIVASLSSHRCSLWDLRRNGAPIMDIGEVGGGCDWADACWSPIEDTALLTASQSDTVPVLYKWDLRYPTAPVRDHRIHAKGVTAIDWHLADPRLLLSASHDGTMLISNPESGEILGRVGVKRDWVRRVRWCPGKPELVAIQYFQSAVQISSLQSMGTQEDSSSDSTTSPSSPTVSHSQQLSPTTTVPSSPSIQEEATNLPVEVSIVPEWCSAGPCGVSFAMGGRHAVHSRVRDPATGKYAYSVEIRRSETSSAAYESAMALQNAVDGGAIGSYCEEKALSATSEGAQLLWTFLSAAVAGQGRNESVRILGFNKSDKSAPATTTTTSTDQTRTTMTSTSSQSHTVNGLVNGMASLSSEKEEEDEDDLLSRVEGLPAIDYRAMDNSGWSLLDSLIAGDLDTVVDRLIDQGDITTALLIARDDEKLMRRAVKAHAQRSTLSPISRLLSFVSARHFAPVIEGFPAEEWRRLMGIVLRADPNASERMKEITHKLANASLSSSPSEMAHCSSIPAVIAGDVEMLLAANKALPIEDRLQQAIALKWSRTAQAKRAYGTEKKEECAEWEAVLEAHCRSLIADGLLDHAWRLVADAVPRSTSLAELRHSLWEACGGRSRTQREAPPNPHATQTALYAAALRGGGGACATGVRRAAPPAYGSAPAAGGWPPAVGMAPPPPTYGQAATTLPPPPSIGGPPSYQQPVQQMQQHYPTMAAPPPPVGTYGAPSKPQMAPPIQQYQPPVAAAVADRVATPIPRAPVAPGWNDPPPMPVKKTEPARPPSVMQISWNPSSQSTAGPPPSAYGMGSYGGAPGVYGLPTAPLSTTQSMGASSLPSSSAQCSPANAAAAAGDMAPIAAPAKIELSPSDEALMGRLQQLGAAIVANNRNPASSRKAEELLQRLRVELAPRLAGAKFSPPTRAILEQAVGAAYAGDMRGAAAAANRLVQTAGGDFVEVSAFQPALKSLFSLYNQSFAR
ncbi:hypothetical protein PENTCL1PPCAC_18689 [Pristionchus entomophagus]|uniref:Uncharacterized protein n=1 Tax=Pristionchus entomophagus TaxID=358040 RepID=A0AAV5TQH4_9BILA|nr:hypothetical protein PENTCL1PPCAC_18689 [Pristionchus entomophagus]